MQDLTEAVGRVPAGHEVFWGVGQATVVIFRNGDVVDIIPLERNTEASALSVAQRWFENR